MKRCFKPSSTSFKLHYAGSTGDMRYLSLENAVRKLTQIRRGYWVTLYKEAFRKNAQKKRFAIMLNSACVSSGCVCGGGGR